MAKTTTMKITYNGRDLELAKQKLRDIIEDGAEITAQAAARLAPFDPNSRHASGKTKYPSVHHRDTLSAGKAKSKSNHEEVLGAKNDWGVNWYVKSASGRGYWLEKGTKGNERKYTSERTTHKKRMDVIGKYGLAPDKATKKLMSKGEKRLLTNAIKSLKQTGEVVKFKAAKLHAATPAQPHIMPALAIAKRYIEQKLKDIL